MYVSSISSPWAVGVDERHEAIADVTRDVRTATITLRSADADGARASTLGTHVSDGTTQATSIRRAREQICSAPCADSVRFGTIIMHIASILSKGRDIPFQGRREGIYFPWIIQGKGYSVF